MEFNIYWEIKDSKKGYYKYIISKKKTWKHVGSLLNQMGALVKEDKEKAELLNAFFPSVLAAEVSPQKSQTLGQGEEDWRKDNFSCHKEFG